MTFPASSSTIRPRCGNSSDPIVTDVRPPPVLVTPLPRKPPGTPSNPSRAATPGLEPPPWDQSVHEGERGAPKFGPLDKDARRPPRRPSVWRRHPDRSSPSAAAGSRWSREPAARRLRARPLHGGAAAGLLPAQASGDADHYIVRFYRAFAATAARPSHISLFRREQGPDDLRRHLLSQDLIYVGGGSVVSLLGVWRAHGIDAILREAWEAGVILCGLSAGSLCWFAEAVSGFHGEAEAARGPRPPAVQQLRPLRARSNRREAYHRFLREGMRPRIRGRGRRRPALRRPGAEPRRRLAAGGARLPPRRLRAAGGGDAGSPPPTSATAGRAGGGAARGAVHRPANGA